jgi:hypothetical protein
VDPVPELLRKCGRAGNRTRALWICSQELRALDHRGSLNHLSSTSLVTRFFLHVMNLLSQFGAADGLAAGGIEVTLFKIHPVIFLHNKQTYESYRHQSNSDHFLSGVVPMLSFKDRFRWMVRSWTILTLTAATSINISL